MPTLANIQGSSLVPNIGGGLSDLLLQTFGTKQSRAAGAQQQQLLNVLAGISPTGVAPTIATGAPPGAGTGITPGPSGAVTGTVAGALAGPTLAQKQAALIRFTALNPQAGNAVRQAMESGNKQAAAQMAQQSKEGTQLALQIQRQPDFISKQKALTTAAQLAQSKGEDISRFVELSNLTEPQLDLELEKMLIQGADLQTLVGDALASPEVETPGGQIIKSSEITDGFVVRQDEEGKFTRTRVLDESQVGGSGKFSKAPGVIVETEPGVFAQAIPVLNNRTGKIENVIVPIGGEPVSKLGETAGDTTVRKIEEARGTKLATGEAARITTSIDNGLISAESASTLNRAIELLDSVETGGLDNASLKAKQFFGVESADEAELSAGLGKAVLSQLRQTFGAAFTENEGNRLARIEAGFGKSVAGNRRLLQQTLRLVERSAQRGIDAAIEAKDFRTAQDIQALLDFRLTDNEAGAAPSGEQGATATGNRTPEGFEIFERPDGSTFAVSP